MEKKIIIGVGSQRAGSSFLWRLLGLHPQIKMHPVKELHYFDTLYGIRPEEKLRVFSKKSLALEIDKLCQTKEFGFINPDWQCHLKTHFHFFTTPIEKINYLDLFSGLGEDEGVKFLGESTPEYMLLQDAQISRMRELVGDARIVLMCRNPIKRTISAFRLRLGGGEDEVLPEERERFFLSLLTGNRLWIRTQREFGNYKLAFEKYSKCFSNVLLLPYDDIIDNPSGMLENLSRFLDLAFDEKHLKPAFKTMFNASEVEYSPGPEAMARLDGLFTDQLKEVEDLLGSTLKY